MSETDKIIGNNPAAAFEMGYGQDTFDIYVGPEGGPKRLYALGVKSGVDFKPLCERMDGEHLWITMPGAEPTVANVSFYK